MTAPVIAFLNHRVITFQHPCIEPLGESKTDIEIFRQLCERLVQHARRSGAIASN